MLYYRNPRIMKNALNFIFSYLRGDKGIWMIVILLSSLSLLAVYSSTGTLAYKHGTSAFDFLKGHFGKIALGIIAMFLIHLISYSRFKVITPLAYILSIALLAYALFFGEDVNDAARWLKIPGTPISFQPSDLAKMTLIMLLSMMLSNIQKTIKTCKISTIIILIIPVAITCILILPDNFSTAALLFATSMVLLFIGGVRIKYLLTLFGIGAIVLAIFFALGIGRVNTWKVRAESYIAGGTNKDNFQADQARMAISTGGLTGKGAGQSIQRNTLPHSYSDFIFAFIIEEYGSAISLFFVSFYLILFYRVISMIRKCQTAFPQLLAVGITILIVFQALTHIAVCVGFAPVTGQTLPFLSMGGTSIVITGAQMGMILSVSRYVHKIQTKQLPANNAEQNENM